jgi:glutathione S-transferase
MRLYVDPITVNSRKVLAGLDLIGASFETVHVDYFKGEQKSASYTAINPNAALPTLVDGDLVLWESNAILMYAADKYDNESAYPKNLRERADINRWLLWEASAWFPSCYTYLVENCVKPLLNQEADRDALDAENERFHKLAKILDARLSQEAWLVGAKPTIADIAVAAPMHLYPYQKLPLEAFSNIRRWMREGIESLPCWDRTYVGPGFSLDRALKGYAPMIN